MGWPLLPNALRPIKIYCALPNLGIRTLICRLNFAWRPIFSGLRCFNKPEISKSGPPVPPGGLVFRIFMSWKKSINLSRVWTHKPWISRHAYKCIVGWGREKEKPSISLLVSQGEHVTRGWHVCINVLWGEEGRRRNPALAYSYLKASTLPETNMCV